MCKFYIKKNTNVYYADAHAFYADAHTVFFFLNNKQQTESPFVSRGKLHACFKKEVFDVYLRLHVKTHNV